MKFGMRAFHTFLKGDFRTLVFDAYERLGIMTEADLQAHAWLFVQRFLDKNATRGKYKVLNQARFELGNRRIYPDLAIFKVKRNKPKPWILIELKEVKKLKEKSARREQQKLLNARGPLGVKRSYLIWVARYGKGKALKGPKRNAAWYFYEIPIILQETFPKERVLEWEGRRKPWARWSKSILK